MRDGGRKSKGTSYVRWEDKGGSFGHLLEKGKLVGKFWLHTSWLVAGILGSGARKYDFLELGSQRGSVPSWMGGKDSVFRQSRKFKQTKKTTIVKDKLLLQEVFFLLIYYFTVNES
jgi:hypothetical protein